MGLVPRDAGVMWRCATICRAPLPAIKVGPRIETASKKRSFRVRCFVAVASNNSPGRGFRRKAATDRWGFFSLRRVYPGFAE
jgi:hypothetical protein